MGVIILLGLMNRKDLGNRRLWWKDQNRMEMKVPLESESIFPRKRTRDNRNKTRNKQTISNSANSRRSPPNSINTNFFQIWLVFNSKRLLNAFTGRRLIVLYMFSVRNFSRSIFLSLIYSIFSNKAVLSLYSSRQDKQWMNSTVLSTSPSNRNDRSKKQTSKSTTKSSNSCVRIR